MNLILNRKKLSIKLISSTSFAKVCRYYDYTKISVVQWGKCLMIELQKFYVFVTHGHCLSGAMGGGNGDPQTNQRKDWRIQSIWMDLFLNILEKEDVLTSLSVGTQWYEYCGFTENPFSSHLFVNNVMTCIIILWPSWPTLCRRVLSLHDRHREVIGIKLYLSYTSRWSKNVFMV